MWLCEDIDTQGASIYDVTYISFEIAVTLLRLTSIYSFMKHFKYPFTSRIEHFETSIYTDNAATIRTSNKLFMFVVLIVMISDLFTVYSYVREDILIANRSLEISLVSVAILGRIEKWVWI